MPLPPLKPRLKEALGREALADIGIDSSPEFDAPLFAYPLPHETAVSGGQQAGKSTFEAARIHVEKWTEVPRDPWHTYDGRPPRPWRYWGVMPTYKSAHTELDYLARWAQTDGTLDFYKAPEGSACFLSMMNGRVVVETRTSREPADIAGQPCDGVFLGEAGQQPETSRIAAIGRTSATGGWVEYVGTQEDDENSPRWLWFGEYVTAWLKNGPGASQRAYTLPTWANRGEFPLGEFDPKIDRLRDAYDEYTFDKRVRGIPGGARDKVYPQLTSIHREERPYMKAMPWTVCVACAGRGEKNGAVCMTCRPYGSVKRFDGSWVSCGRLLPWRWLDGAGGFDFGDVHLTALVIVKVNDRGEAWVVECVVIKDGDMDAVKAERERLRDKWQVYRWGADPNLRIFANQNKGDTIAVSGSGGSRGARIGAVRGLMNSGSLFYDLEGEGVPALYLEQSRVRYFKNAQGQLELWRVDDDRTAALEDAIEVLYGTDRPLEVNPGAMKARELMEAGAVLIVPEHFAELELRRPEDDPGKQFHGLFGERRK